MIPAAVLVASLAVFPIAPVALSELCDRSDLVAVVRPGSGEGSGFDCRVTAEVLETVHGEPHGTLTVSYACGLVCPRPPSYPEGEVVLAFLSWDEEDGVHRTVGLSYGTKIVPAEERRLFAARVRELFVLREREGEAWRESAAFVDWAVRCAEEPGTRSDGLLVLDGARRFGVAFARDPALLPRLDDAQWRRLVESLRSGSLLRSSDLDLLAKLSDGSDPLLDRVLVELAADRDRARPWALERLMRIAAERWDDPYVALLVEGVREIAREGWKDEPLYEPLREAFLVHARARLRSR